MCGTAQSKAACYLILVAGLAISPSLVTRSIPLAPDGLNLASVSAEAEQLSLLLAAVGKGDRRAFEQLYRHANSPLFGLLLRILRRRDWAEEALQDCFIRIWQKSDTYDPSRGAPLTWLSTIARYRAFDLLRTKSPEVEMPEEYVVAPMTFADPGQNLIEGAIEADGIASLSDCLQELTDECHKCVLLAYYEGYTHRELSKAMNAPLGTVKSWVRRGLLQLRECLDVEQET